MVERKRKLRLQVSLLMATTVLARQTAMPLVYPGADQSPAQAAPAAKTIAELRHDLATFGSGMLPLPGEVLLLAPEVPRTPELLDWMTKINRIIYPLLMADLPDGGIMTETEVRFRQPEYVIRLRNGSILQMQGNGEPIRGLELTE